MRNRAKCKLCGSIIESFHSTDYVMCKCEEIAVDGGPALICHAKSFDNFLRVDDEGNEIIVTIEGINKKPDIQLKPTKKEILNVLEEMIKTIDNLPPGAMQVPITHYDYQWMLLLLSSILKADCNDSN